jgi:FBP C-terminal treble-clef zinc-finger
MNPLQRDRVISAFPAEDRQELSLPAFDSLPWQNLDFLGWCDRAGDKAYLVFEDGGAARGLTLERMAVRTSNVRAFMCSICRTTHGPRGIANYSYRCQHGAGYDTLTDTFCGDLQCSLYVRGLLYPDVAQFHETISVERKIERLLEGFDRFRANIVDFEARRERRRFRVV